MSLGPFAGDIVSQEAAFVDAAGTHAFFDSRTHTHRLTHFFTCFFYQCVSCVVGPCTLHTMRTGSLTYQCVLCVPGHCTLQVTSSAKKQRSPDSTRIHQTPEGAFYDLQRNAWQVRCCCAVTLPPPQFLLLNARGIEAPPSTPHLSLAAELW